MQVNNVKSNSRRQAQTRAMAQLAILQGMSKKLVNWIRHYSGST